jgi:hypothetical protein
MKNLLIPIFIVASTLLTGCVSYQAANPQEAFDKVTYTADKYTGTRTYISPMFQIKKVEFLDQSFVNGNLTLTKSNTSEKYCILGRYVGESWAFFSDAYDSDGQHLGLEKVNTSVQNMLGMVKTVEDICIPVTRQYLESKQQSGLDIKIMGQNRSVLANIQGFYIQGFLKAIDLFEDKFYKK